MKQIRDGDNIEKKIRAFWFPPYDGAYVKINGQKYTLINRQLLMPYLHTLSITVFTMIYSESITKHGF